MTRTTENDTVYLLLMFHSQVPFARLEAIKRSDKVLHFGAELRVAVTHAASARTAILSLLELQYWHYCAWSTEGRTVIVTMNSSVVCDVKQCSPTSPRTFRTLSACLLLLAGFLTGLLFDLENGGSQFFRNVDGLLPDYHARTLIPN